MVHMQWLTIGHRSSDSTYRIEEAVHPENREHREYEERDAEFHVGILGNEPPNNPVDEHSGEAVS